MAKSDPYAVTVGIKVIGPREIEALERSLARWRSVALHAVAVAERQDAHIDRLAVQLAAQYLLNEELKDRVTWYRRILAKIGHAVAREDGPCIKRMSLLAQHRLNSES